MVGAVLLYARDLVVEGLVVRHKVASFALIEATLPRARHRWTRPEEAKDDRGLA
jgi:hypothetical protein